MSNSVNNAVKISSRLKWSLNRLSLLFFSAIPLVSADAERDSAILSAVLLAIGMFISTR